jgi:hypothetical protein
VCTALNSPEAGDAAVAIVRQRQNLRAEKVIARKNIHIIRINRNYSILHRYLMSFYTSFRPLPPALGQINPGSVVLQSMPASNANSYSRRQADLRIQAEAEEIMNEYGGVCAWIFPYVIPFSTRKAEMVIN